MRHIKLSEKKKIDALLASNRARAAGVGVVPASDFQANVAPIGPGAVAAVALTSNFTPAVTGKMDVIITGVVQCSESTTTSHPFAVGISRGVGPGTVLYSLATIPHVQNAVAGANGSTPFALVVSLDKLPSGAFTFPVGTAATLNTIVTGDGTGTETIPIAGLQMKVQERRA